MVSPWIRLSDTLPLSTPTRRGMSIRFIGILDKPRKHHRTGRAGLAARAEVRLMMRYPPQSIL